MVKCLPEFEYFTVFLKNKNIIFKIRRSKVTDYAALKQRRLSRVYAYAHAVSPVISLLASDEKKYGNLQFFEF